jgi:hypothetical protein
MTLLEFKEALELLKYNLVCENELYGFCLPNKFVYHWFRTSHNEDYMFFNHSYSQNTGKSKKSIRQGIKVINSLEKKFNKLKNKV